MDRHKLWRIVARNREDWQKAGPDDHEAVVEVTLVGREPFVVGRVETSRDPNDPWIFLYSYSAAGFEHQMSSDSMVITREEHILSVEIKYRRAGKEPMIGFVHSTTATTE